MAAASASGVFLGLVLVYLLHLTDDTIRSGEDLRLMTGLPCFATIPEINRRALGHLTIEEYATRRPLTAFAEHIRSVRASLSLSAHRPLARPRASPSSPSPSADRRSSAGSGC